MLLCPTFSHFDQYHRWCGHTRVIVTCKRSAAVGQAFNKGLTFYCRLEAYYVYIHPYFPILPPPNSIPTDRPIAVSESEQNLNNADYEPSSPLSLGILSILSLIPHPDDPNPGSEEAVLFRRNYAECLAQSALESINIETEVPASSTSPAQVLSEVSDVYQRVPFHQNVPVELESIIALSILSIYEYAQRGNIKRMRQRAGQAIMAAMDMCLHSEPEMEKPDEFTEARRRAWWMTVGSHPQPWNKSRG